MASTKITTKQFAKYMGQLGAQWRPALIRGTVAGAARTIPWLMQRTMMAPPASPRGMPGALNTGLYKAAWRSAPLPNGARVFNTQPYSSIIEYGRRPAHVGRAGIRNLEGWARRKLQLSAEEAKSAAWAIAKTLAKRKLEAREVLTGDEKGLIELVEKEILHELEIEVKK